MFSPPLPITDSCCTDGDIQDISHVPSDINKNEPWDKCGPLSSEYVYVSLTHWSTIWTGSELKHIARAISYITTFFTNHLLLMHWLNSILIFFTSTFYTDKYKNATNASNCSNGIKCLNTSLTNSWRPKAEAANTEHILNVCSAGR